MRSGGLQLSREVTRREKSALFFLHATLPTRTKGTAMTTIPPEQVLHFARQLSPTDQRWLVLHLQEHLAATLPEHATLEEAVDLYLVEACSLGRAAELAGVTRWDILDALQARGAMQHPSDFRSADDMDDLAERLEQRGML